MQVPEGYMLIKIEEYERFISTISHLQATIMALEVRIKDLELQLKRNSRNSHQPPSTDGFKKEIQNNRIKSERKAGGQPGHEGTTLAQVENPNKIISYPVEICQHCGVDLQNIEATDYQRRQVFDIPPVKVEVTEHRPEVKHCPICKKATVADCPVPACVQYGPGVKSMTVYLNQYQMLPFERVSETLSDLFNCPISTQVIEQSNKLTFERLYPKVETEIKQAVINSPVVDCDETGLRCEGKTKYVHNYSTPDYTYYSIHPRRGTQAMEDIGILPLYQGILVHDRFLSYDKYLKSQHALCNAHLLRDLKSVQEEDFNKSWAKQMEKLILSAYELSQQSSISQQQIWAVENQYDQIVEQGIRDEPGAMKTGRRGKKSKGKSLNLLECFRDRKKQILLFLHDSDVPFDNNLAERDLRMVKLKQKISGCFRTHHGAVIFCRIRSYISTMKKQNQNVWIALKQILCTPSVQQPIPVWT
jgi:transposase